MRILHLEAGRNLYGGAQQVLYLLQGLQGLGGSTNLLACPTDSALADAADEVADAVFPTPMGGEADLGFVFRIRRLLWDTQAHLLHIHSRRGADIWGGLAGRSAGVKVVLSRRVDNPEPQWLVSPKYRLYHRVITISEGIRRVLLWQGVPPERVSCIPSAVDANRYQLPCDLPWFQKAFDLGPDNKAVGVVAQFIERKGHRSLLKGIPHILEEMPEARFLLFGKGPLDRELWRRCAELGVAHAVRFPGFRTDLERVLPCLHVLVHPALQEGLGVALLQAAAAGVPIVASAVGGIPELIRHKVQGLLVEPGDPVAISQAVQCLLQEPEFAQRLGQAARERVQGTFSVPTMAARHLQIYRALLEGWGEG